VISQARPRCSRHWQAAIQIDASGEWPLHLQRGLVLFDRTGEIYNRAQVVFNMALVYKDKGDLVRAHAMFEEA